MKGVYLGKMRDQEQRKLIARLHRLAGQVRSLEGLIVKQDNQQAIGQFEAVIAAAKASLTYYLEAELLTDRDLGDQEKKQLLRLIRKFS